MIDRTSRQRPIRHVPVVLVLTLALATGLATGLAGCSRDVGSTRQPVASRTAVTGPAPTPDQIVHAAVVSALKASTARFTFTLNSRQTGSYTSARGSGRVDLAHGRLDHVQKVRSTSGTWSSRYLIVGERVYVQELTGVKQGKWYQAAVDANGMTYTRDGFTDPMEFLRVLLTLRGGVTVIGDREIDGTDVVAYAGVATPSDPVARSYRRPGRKAGQLAGNLDYLGVRQVAVHVYLDGRGLPARITLSGTGAKRAGFRAKVTATLTTADWGTPEPIRAPAFRVPSFDQLYD